MRDARRLWRLLRRGARDARRAATALGPAGRALAERLAYRPRDVVVVGLLAGGLFGGLLVERWRARHPAAADRLETEPPRLTSVAAVPPAPRPRSRAALPLCPWPDRRTADAGFSRLGRPRLDLNRATPRQLARLAGISWGLAARIVAARETFEGREARFELEPRWRERGPGFRRRAPVRPPDEAEPEAADPAPTGTPAAPDPSEPEPGPESGEETSDPEPR
jgi:hypothetical protein